VRNPERWYEALDEAGALVGNFYFEQKGDALEVGLGLRPDLTGRGLGLEFLLAGIDFGRRRFGLTRVILNVAAFNERAIKVYERAGFRETGRHTRRFDRWGDIEFVDMEQAAERG
jgi:RimJ/RimL family protein N-acetyltransferase